MSTFSGKSCSDHGGGKMPTGGGSPPHGTGRRRYLPDFGRLSERLIFKIKKLIKDSKDLKIIRTGGLKAKKRTVATIRRVATKIERDPRKSIRKLAAEHNMAVNSMKRILNEDLGMVSRIVQEKSILTIDYHEKRRERARKLLLRLKKEDAGKVWIFSD
jgi:hypothetical protein